MNRADHALDHDGPVVRGTGISRRANVGALLLIVLLLALAATVACAGPVAWENPRQHIRVESGEKLVPVVFRFRIDGDAPVTFGRIAPGCGCTLGSLERATWQPGETGELVARIRTGELESTKTVGIRVAYVSPALAAEELSFTVEVRPWADVHPRLLWWGRDAAADAKEISIRFGAEFAASTLEIIGDGPAGFDVAPARRTDDGVLTLTIVPSTTAAPATEQLHLRLVRSDGRTLERTIFLRVM